MNQSLKQQVYELIKAGNTILKEISREYDDPEDVFMNDVHDVWKIIPKNKIKKYLIYLSKIKTEKHEEIEEFKNLINGNTQNYLFAYIVEDMMYEIDENLSNEISGDFDQNDSDDDRFYNNPKKRGAGKL